MVGWDLWISYGMLRCWKYEKFGLREELHYPVWSYYIMLPYAELARFSYVFALVLDINNYPVMANPLFYSSILFGIEVLRRWCWAIMRLETEMIFNLENFRQIDGIPEVADDAEESHL